MLMARADALLDQLAEDDGDAADWVLGHWSPELVKAVEDAMSHVRSLHDDLSSQKNTYVASTVTALLEALESVVASQVDIKVSLLTALSGTGDYEAVAAVLEHGLEAMEALATASPPPSNKA